MPKSLSENYLRPRILRFYRRHNLRSNLRLRNRRPFIPQICDLLFHILFESNSLESTLRVLAISNNVSILGCISFVHHLETVVLFTPIFSASHISVLPFSAKTTLILL